MFHNKQRNKNDEFVSPRKKLKRHVETLFLENKLSGQETDELATNIGQCVGDFQSSGSTAKNAARDWMRKCLKKVVGLQSMWLRSQLGMASCKHRDCHKWPSCYHMKLFSIC